MIIKNYLTLPEHPTRRWKQRQQTTKIIFHHMYWENSIEALNTYYITSDEKNYISPNGITKIPFHFILYDNMIHKVNDIESLTWHCPGDNETSIGVCIINDLNRVLIKNFIQNMKLPYEFHQLCCTKTLQRKINEIFNRT